MAATVTALKRRNAGNKIHVQALVTPSASYLSGTPSEAVTYASLGLRTCDYVYAPTQDILDPSVALTAATTKRGFSVTKDAHAVGDTTVKLRFWETSGTEVADAQDKSASTFPLVFVGT